MVAIETKYYGPTNSRGSKIIAKTTNHRLTVSYDHGLDLDENHAAAAVALCRKMYWTGELLGSSTKAGMVFVFANEDKIKI